MVASRISFTKELRYLLLVAGFSLILATAAFVIHFFGTKELLGQQVAYTSQKAEFDRLVELAESISREDSLLGTSSTIDSMLFGLEVHKVLETNMEESRDEIVLVKQEMRVWGVYPKEYRLSVLDSIEAIRHQLIDNLNRQSGFLKKENALFKGFVLLINISLLIVFPGRWACTWFENQKSLK